MKVLAVSAPLVGHLLPLANALRDAGHDVLPAAGGGEIAAMPQPASLVAASEELRA